MTMHAKFISQLSVSRSGAVTDNLGKVYGWVRKTTDEEWELSLPGGVLVGAYTTRRESLRALIETYQEGIPL